MKRQIKTPASIYAKTIAQLLSSIEGISKELLILQTCVKDTNTEQLKNLQETLKIMNKLCDKMCITPEILQDYLSLNQCNINLSTILPNINTVKQAKEEHWPNINCTIGRIPTKCFKLMKRPFTKQLRLLIKMRYVLQLLKKVKKLNAKLLSKQEVAARLGLDLKKVPWITASEYQALLETNIRFATKYLSASRNMPIQLGVSWFKKLKLSSDEQHTVYLQEKFFPSFQKLFQEEWIEKQHKIQQRRKHDRKIYRGRQVNKVSKVSKGIIRPIPTHQYTKYEIITNYGIGGSSIRFIYPTKKDLREECINKVWNNRKITILSKWFEFEKDKKGEIYVKGEYLHDYLVATGLDKPVINDEDFLTQKHIANDCRVSQNTVPMPKYVQYTFALNTNNKSITLDYYGFKIIVETEWFDQGQNKKLYVKNEHYVDFLSAIYRVIKNKGGIHRFADGVQRLLEVKPNVQGTKVVSIQGDKKDKNQERIEPREINS